MAVIVAMTIPVIVIITLGILTLGRILTTRQRLQYAADAVATEGALMAERYGLAGFGLPNSGSDYPWMPTLASEQARLASIRNGNLPLVGPQDWPKWSFETIGGQEWARSSTALATSVVGFDLSAEATWKVKQLRTTEPRRRPPSLILVLDYSNSMNRRSNAFGKAIVQLRSVVSQFLDSLPLDDLQVGLVIYGTNVYHTVTPATRSASSNFTAIRGLLGGAASGDTATGEGLDAAVDLLMAGADFGRNLLLVSDGEPCCAANADRLALTAASRARAQGVQVFTVEVHNVNSGGHMHDVLVSIAGDASRHFEAENTAGLLALFSGVHVRPQCDFAVPAPGDPFVYLRNEGTGQERALRRYTDPADIACPEHCDVYGYRVEGNLAILSPIACEQIWSGARTGLARWDRAYLRM